MIKNIIGFLLSFLLFVFDLPVYSSNFSSKTNDNYTLKISKKFSKTYCNTIQFGISKDGALKFSIGETNKEFQNNKFNIIIDYELLKKDILLGLESNCQIYDFPVNELENLVFK